MVMGRGFLYLALPAILSVTLLSHVVHALAPGASNPDPYLRRHGIKRRHSFGGNRAKGKIYGVNLGSWLVLEAWMLPQEWLDMGGQSCSDCSTCIASEFAFVQAYPDTADATFNQHWTTWFTQDHVNQLAAAGINTVRVPLGYWIVEPLVNRSSEYYPRGGILQLQRGLAQLKAAGIQAILDHHALPGVQTAGQQFTGRCTSDVEFYTQYNYHRALIWAAVMTSLSHLDPAFSSVFAIEAVNEPIMDAAQTPNYGTYQMNFVKVVRAVELMLGIPVPGYTAPTVSSSSNFTAVLVEAASSNYTTTSYANLFNPEVQSVLRDAAPIMLEVAAQLGIGGAVLDYLGQGAWAEKTPLVTNFMDVNWQYDNPPNPAYAAIGPQGYDNHLYYSFGGVADATPDAYMISICNLQRVQADAALGNSPLWFGEWGLPTQFTATDEFLYMWADAQKLAYSQGAGWIFWNFRVENSTLAGDLGRQWSYLEGLELGYFTQDPSQYHNASVCAPYITNTTTASA
ncbi:glycoside hydrolase family 5 protein [Jaapia argillacea MUCL 33604]|uniref:Glycoside hydrolase family 5 protein n=1 Tax=Jaapia argillacea MUCL 33604 TaxID=933084 RepID=A0A067Q4C5_9AGAM|nr:glycoside hydrolase family 5 protein [Jaapia argillacea MUCL 33604]